MNQNSVDMKQGRPSLSMKIVFRRVSSAESSRTVKEFDSNKHQYTVKLFEYFKKSNVILVRHLHDFHLNTNFHCHIKTPNNSEIYTENYTSNMKGTSIHIYERYIYTHFGITAAKA